jgi:anti-anti-sigma regulatory factor
MDEQNLKTVYIRLQVTATQADVDKAKASLGEKLNLSVKGLMVNCSETQLNETAIQMLCTLTTVARKDGKRLALVNLSPQANEAIQNNQSKNLLDLFGEKLKQPTASKRAPKRNLRRWFALVMLPIVVGLPLIALVDYLINHLYSSDAVVVNKSFEAAAEDRFVIFGTIDTIHTGKRQPDSGAIVIAWINAPQIDSEANVGTLAANVTYADAQGRFRLPIKTSNEATHLSVRITVLSETLDATSHSSYPIEPAKLRPNAYHPTRQTQTYDHVIESGKPVRLNLLFF